MLTDHHRCYPFNRLPTPALLISSFQSVYIRTAQTPRNGGASRMEPSGMRKSITVVAVSRTLLVGWRPLMYYIIAVLFTRHPKHLSASEQFYSLLLLPYTHTNVHSYES
jgi:hypothetical protein